MIMPTFFGNPTDREIELQGEVTRLQQELDTTNRLVAHQEAELHDYQQIGGLVAKIKERADAIEHGTDVSIDPEVEAAAEVEEEFLADVAAGVVNVIKKERRAALVAEFGPDWIKEETKRQREAIAASGEFDHLRDTMRAGKVAEIRNGLLGTEKGKIEAELATDEAQASVHAEAEANVAASQELAEYKQKKRAEALDVAERTATENAKSEIDAEIAAEMEDYAKTYADQWKDSRYGRDYRNKATARAKEKIQGMIPSQVGEIIDDEELIKLAEEKAEVLKPTLAAEIIFAKYLSEFTTEGVDFTGIPVDTAVTIYLGTTKMIKNPAYEDYGYNNNNGKPKEIKSAQVRRRIDLLSKGDGAFYVKADSLDDSTDPYVKDNSIANTIITMGREMRNNGDKTSVLDPRVSMGDVLFYDDESSESSIKSSMLPVACVEIEGVKSRKDIKDENYVWV
jgi:hypothetical protein